MNTPSEVKVRERLKLFMGYIFLTIMVLLLLVVLRLFQQYVISKLQFNNKLESIQFAIGLISQAMPLAIITINNYYQVLIDMFITRELWNTKTKLYISMAYKKIMGGFVFYMLMVYVIYGVLYDNMYGPNGFLYVLERILFLRLQKYEDSSYSNQTQEQDLEMKKKLSVLTQKQANELCELPQHNLSNSFADVLQLMIQTAFAAPLLPIVIVYGLVGLCSYYWVDKLILVTKRSVKESISDKMPHEMLEVLDVTVLIFTFSSLYFRYSLSGQYTWISIFLIFIAIAYSVLPVQTISMYLFPQRSAKSEEMTHQQAMEDLDTDYDRENPIIRGQALGEFLQIRKKKMQSAVRKRVMNVLKIKNLPKMAGSKKKAQEQRNLSINPPNDQDKINLSNDPPSHKPSLFKQQE